jgi:plastocyanin
MTALMHFRLIAGLAAAGALLAGASASPASAADTITAQDNFFGPPTTFAMSQGENPTLQNNGASQHNVTATQAGPDGGALFRSATIGGGASTAVNGTQYLTSGSYPFLCTIHGSSMSGTLNVSGAGTPQPRPQITLKLSSRKIEKVAKKGRLQVSITSSTKVDDASVTAKLGKLTIARAPDLSLSAGQQTRVLKLNKQGKAKLGKKSKATIVLNGTVAFGSPATAKGKLK